jgi:hypothetical protein
MTWLARVKPHYLVLYFCGHVKAQCACSSASGGPGKKRPTATVTQLCPTCTSGQKT